MILFSRDFHKMNNASAKRAYESAFSYKYYMLRNMRLYKHVELNLQYNIYCIDIFSI